MCSTPDSTQTNCLQLDIAVIGGGIAGLWLLNLAQGAGYTCALFEACALGSEQTIASQGMIHGGMKYTLSGALSSASESIADMPAHWRRCLDGSGEIDLRKTQRLSEHFFLWSSESASSRLATFLASKLVRGRVDPVDYPNYPQVLKHQAFKGSLYRVADLVLDVPSLLSNLAQGVSDRLFTLDWSDAELLLNPAGEVELHLGKDPDGIRIKAKRFVFCAGKGNQALLRKLGLTHPKMQVRPLQQVMIKHRIPHRFYGHCLGADTTPRLTISTHVTRDGASVWYLGGSLAEQGAHQSSQEVITAAQRELTALLPWIDFSDSQWASLAVARAEQRQKLLARPDAAFVGKAPGAQNLLVAWPTKLTLAPKMAREALDSIRNSGIFPSGAASALALLRTRLPCPPLAEAPWDLAFNPKTSLCPE